MRSKCRDLDHSQMEVLVVEVVEMETEVVVWTSKTSVEGEGKDSRVGIRGGPTKLPGEGGGHQDRPGKEEPLVGMEAGRSLALQYFPKQCAGK